WPRAAAFDVVRRPGGRSARCPGWSGRPRAEGWEAAAPVPPGAPPPEHRLVGAWVVGTCVSGPRDRSTGSVEQVVEVLLGGLVTVHGPVHGVDHLGEAAVGHVEGVVELGGAGLELLV